jgi:DNA-directed RNA polymerase subunit L
MSVKIVKESKNKLEIEIPGEDHTVGNLLRTTLLKNEHVKFAGYQIVHPLTGGIYVVIQTDGNEKPKDALLEAISQIESVTKEFKDKFKISV